MRRRKEQRAGSRLVEVKKVKAQEGVQKYEKGRNRRAKREHSTSGLRGLEGSVSVEAEKKKWKAKKANGRREGKEKKGKEKKGKNR